MQALFVEITMLFNIIYLYFFPISLIPYLFICYKDKMASGGDKAVN